MDSKSYALLAQWLNGMSFAVNSYLIPIQLCGGKKTKCHRYKCIHDISVFLPRFYALPRYCDDKIRSILQNHPPGALHPKRLRIFLLDELTITSSSQSLN